MYIKTPPSSASYFPTTSKALCSVFPPSPRRMLNPTPTLEPCIKFGGCPSSLASPTFPGRSASFPNQLCRGKLSCLHNTSLLQRTDSNTHRPGTSASPRHTSTNTLLFAFLKHRLGTKSKVVYKQEEGWMCYPKSTAHPPALYSEMTNRKITTDLVGNFCCSCS